MVLSIVVGSPDRGIEGSSRQGMPGPGNSLFDSKSEKGPLCRLEATEPSSGRPIKSFEYSGYRPLIVVSILRVEFGLPVGTKIIRKLISCLE